MEKKKTFDKLDAVAFSIFLVFFGCLYFTGEPMYLGDTFQHENQFVTRDPIYALLIQFLRWLSLENYYQLIILVQNILAIISNTLFVSFIRRYFTLKAYWMPWIVIIILSPHIMTPIGSSTHMVLTNALLSEGISFSFYPFFIMYLLKAMRDRQIWGRNSLIALGWALWLSLIRGQLMTLLIVWLIVMGSQALLSRQGKRIWLILLMFVLTFAGRGLLVKCYNYLEQGLFVSTASGQAMAVANVLYVADREDGGNIKDNDLRELFYEIYDAAYADGLNYRFAEEGLLARAAHHESCHDILNFDYFEVAAKEYVTEHEGTTVGDYQLMMVEVDQVASALMKELLPQVIGRYCYNYLAIAVQGFIRSVAYVNPILNWYAFLMYLCAVIMMVLLLHENSQSKSAVFMAVVLLMIVGNVTATSFMLQCISRYMLYNLPLFYIAGFAMLVEYVQLRNRKKERQNGLQKSEI